MQNAEMEPVTILPDPALIGFCTALICVQLQILWFPFNPLQTAVRRNPQAVAEAPFFFSPAVVISPLKIYIYVRSEISTHVNANAFDLSRTRITVGRRIYFYGHVFFEFFLDHAAVYFNVPGESR